MAGFKSNLYFLPDSGIGAVLLTNSDNGGRLLGPFGRGLLEAVFDGKIEAAGDVAAQAAHHKAALAKDRERLVVPAAPALVNALAKRYSSKEPGELAVRGSVAEERRRYDRVHYDRPNHRGCLTLPRHADA